MTFLNEDEAAEKRVLSEARVIAVVGYSPQAHRASHRIGQYLQGVGYKVYPVNPTVDEIDGMKSYPALKDVPEPIDIVDVFRQPQHLPGIVREAIDAGAKTVWAQMGVTHEDAKQAALEAGLNYAEDRCIMVEHRRLLPDTANKPRPSE
jgi:hypothetical protein